MDAGNRAGSPKTRRMKRFVGILAASAVLTAIRVEPALTGGGFRRFLDQGYRFTQASLAHAIPETAPGHETLATGVFPARGSTG